LYIFVYIFDRLTALDFLRNRRKEESVAKKDDQVGRDAPHSASRVPSDSLFYDRVIPILLVVLGIIMAILILFALGVLLGIVPFK
jgi:hypothetical protein